MDWVEGGIRVFEVLGAFVVGNRVTGKEIGCDFWGAGFSDLSVELAVLLVEKSTEGGEVFGGDGVEEKVGVVGGRFVFDRGSFRLTSVCRAVREEGVAKETLSDYGRLSSTLEDIRMRGLTNRFIARSHVSFLWDTMIPVTLYVGAVYRGSVGVSLHESMGLQISGTYIARSQPMGS